MTLPRQNVMLKNAPPLILGYVNSPVVLNSKKVDPEIEDKSGFLFWSILVLTAHVADSLCTPHGMQVL
jgi:hypothetical protein